MLKEIKVTTHQKQPNELGPLLISLSKWEMDTFFPADQADRLKSVCASTQCIDPTQINLADWEKLLKSVQPQVIVSCWRTFRLPVDAGSLKYLCHLTGSVRGIVPRELVVGGLKITNWGTFAAPYVAEHALLLMLGALRSLLQWPGGLNASSHPEHTAYLKTRTLHHKRVSIHGFGQIARELIKLLQPFQVQISCFSAGVPRQLMLDHGVRVAESLEALADEAEIFVTCEALTDHTRESIGKSVLSRLQKGAVFVNVGRGAVVNEPALAEVALERNLRVASDVFTKEPLPPDSPLRSLPDAIYSPHIGGATLDMYPRCGELSLVNLEHYFAGRPLEREVTLELFDRST